MHEIRIPRLGWSMEEGTLIGWLKKPGEQVAVGDPLFEFEGEKALQTIESIDAGKLYLPPDTPALGSVIPVGALLGFLLVEGEAPPGEAPVGAAPAKEATVSASNGAANSAAVVSPAPHANAQSANVSPASVASPRARRAAAESGVDWTTLEGTGRGGRIREADVLAARASVRAAPASTPATSVPAPSPSRRKAIADRLRISRDRTIPVTLTSSADATHLVSLRGQFKATQARIVPAFTDIIARLVASVLPRHPQVAVRRDPAANTFHPVADSQYHIGIAVDTPDGLLVPIVRDVLHKSLVNVAAESQALIERARTGRLTGAEMQDGILTITNLGAYGIQAFTPVINYPEVVILGLGAIRREAVVLADDRIVPQSRITLSLTFDHAALDGAPAAAFLRDVVTALENPAACLLG